MYMLALPLLPIPGTISDNITLVLIISLHTFRFFHTHTKSTFIPNHSNDSVKIAVWNILEIDRNKTVLQPALAGWRLQSDDGESSPVRLTLDGLKCRIIFWEIFHAISQAIFHTISKKIDKIIVCLGFTSL